MALNSSKTSCVEIPRLLRLILSLLLHAILACSTLCYIQLSLSLRKYVDNVTASSWRVVTCFIIHSWLSQKPADMPQWGGRRVGCDAEETSNPVSKSASFKSRSTVWSKTHAYTEFELVPAENPVAKSNSDYYYYFYYISNRQILYFLRHYIDLIALVTSYPADLDY